MVKNFLIQNLFITESAYSSWKLPYSTLKVLFLWCIILIRALSNLTRHPLMSTTSLNLNLMYVACRFNGLLGKYVNIRAILFYRFWIIKFLFKDIFFNKIWNLCTIHCNGLIRKKLQKLYKTIVTFLYRKMSFINPQ